MDQYQAIIKIIDANLIYCLIPMVLTLSLVKLTFKDRFPTQKALRVIGWSMVGYTVVVDIHFLVDLFCDPALFGGLQSVSTSYLVAYWIMVGLAMLLPFTLVMSKWAKRAWYVILVAFLMKSGAYLERYIIVITNLHRDYTPENWASDSVDKWFVGVLMTALQGAVLALLILGAVQMVERKKDNTEILDSELNK